MGTYVREKVLRIPVDKINLNHIKEKMLFAYVEIGKFQLSPAKTLFFDYVLEHEWDADGEYGKVRDLYDSEKAKYLTVFQQLDPDVNMDDVKLVEFCWYNCSEAPGYYDLTEDRFYREV